MAKDSKLHVFCNGWCSDVNGNIAHTGRYNVQMHAKDTVVMMLQRRLGIPVSRTASIGDSRGDISMFNVSDFSIAFNPLDDEVIKYADICIKTKNLELVSSAIISHFM